MAHGPNLWAGGIGPAMLGDGKTIPLIKVEVMLVIGIQVAHQPLAVRLLQDGLEKQLPDSLTLHAGINSQLV